MPSSLVSLVVWLGEALAAYSVVTRRSAATQSTKVLQRDGVGRYDLLELTSGLALVVQDRHVDLVRLATAEDLSYLGRVVDVGQVSTLHNVILGVATSHVRVREAEFLRVLRNGIHVIRFMSL